MKQRYGILVLLSMLAACAPGADDPAQPLDSGPKQEGMVQERLGGEELFVLACQGCHNIQAGAPHRVGPNLYGIAGQPAASREGFNYSPALQQAGITWTTASLTAWVVATESLVPGTWMLYHNILQPDEVTPLIGYIEQSQADSSP